MTPLFRCALAFALLLLGMPQAALGTTCYQVLERDDSVVYRATQPPFPMDGDLYAQGQQRLRVAGRHLLWFETEICQGVSSENPMRANVALSSDAAEIINARSFGAPQGVTTPPSSGSYSPADAGVGGSTGRGPTYTGPRGGQYTRTPSGGKNYNKR